MLTVHITVAIIYVRLYSASD